MGELEHQNKMLEANYKSTSQGERKELLDRVALAEVKAGDLQSHLNLKDDEIATLKKEIDSLRERVRTAYAEKDRQAEDLNQQIQRLQSVKTQDKQLGEAYWRQELEKEQAISRQLSETIKSLEKEAVARQNEFTELEAKWKARVAETEKSSQKKDTTQAQSQEELRKEMESQRAEYERLLQEKEQQSQKQKNEWAEVLSAYNLALDIWQPTPRDRRPQERHRSP